MKDITTYSLPEIIMLLGLLCDTENMFAQDDECNDNLAEFFSNYVMPQSQKHGFSFKYDCKKSFSSFLSKNKSNVEQAAKLLLINSFKEVQTTKYHSDSNNLSLKTHAITWNSAVITALIEHVNCAFDDNGTALYLQTIDNACTQLSEEFKKIQDFLSSTKLSHVQLLWHIALCELNEQALAYVVGPWLFTRFLSKLQKTIEGMKETPAADLSDTDKAQLIEALAVLQKESDDCCFDCDDDEEDDDDDYEDDEEEEEEEEEIKPCASKKCCKRK